MQSLTIFIPFYNDAGTVEKMITEAYKYASKITDNLEVIAINDGSQDNTAEELNKMKEKFINLKIISHEKNRGYGGALISGINASTKEWVFYTDGDAQYHLDELQKFWDMKDGCDVVNGFKLNRSDNVVRTFVGHLYRKGTKLIFNTPIHDIDCDYRLIKGDLLRTLNLESTSGAITVEMVKKLYIKKAIFKEIGVAHYERVYGTSTFFTPKRVLQTIYDELRLYIKFKKYA